MTSLQSASFIGLIIYFVLIIILITKDRKSTDPQDYFFGGQKLPFWALSITFIASWWGAGSALSTANLGYETGISAFWYYGVPVLFSTALMFLLATRIRKAGAVTQGFIFKERYNLFCSRLLSLIILLFMIVTAASQMVGIGQFFGTYLGFSYSSAVIIGTLITLTYSTIGGFRGVVLTDILQFFFLLISSVIVFLVVMNAAGGWDAPATIAKKAISSDRPDYIDFFSHISDNLVYILTFGCAWMIQANVWQRIAATRNINDARRMTAMSFFIYIPLYLMVVFTGMAGLVLYEQLPAGGIVPAIIHDYMSPALSAFVFVGICSAIMSTMDSLINTGAMTITLDFVAPSGVTKSKDNSHLIAISRVATIIVTILALLIALQIRSILQVSWIAADFLATGAFVPLILGFIWSRGNSAGASVSMIWGLSYTSYNLASTLGVSLPMFWDLGSASQVLIGMLGSLFLFVFISLTTQTTEVEKDKDPVLSPS